MVRLSLQERKERSFLFISLFIFSIFCLGGALVQGRGKGDVFLKADLEMLLQEEDAFESAMEEINPELEKLQEDIMSFNAEVNALFVENDIRMGVMTISSFCEERSSNPMYKSFKLFGDLCLNLFADKRELSGNQKDIVMIQQMVEDCELVTSELQSSVETGQK